MDKYIIYIIFLVFNCIFGISAVSVLGGGIYLIIKLEFNQYIIVFFCTGLIMTGISIMGCFSQKRPIFLLLYMILISIIFILELIVVFVLKFYTDINDYIKKNIDNIGKFAEEEKEKIMNIIMIILLSAAGCCLLSFLCAFFYYRKLKEKEKKFKEEKLKGDDILKGLDYTNLNPDMTTASN